MNQMNALFPKAALVALGLGLLTFSTQAQEVPQPPKMVPQMTEFWEPEVKAITPGTNMAAPSDAIVLFDGKDLSQWVSTNDPAKPAQWWARGYLP